MPLTKDLNNTHDAYAVSVIKNGLTVGHVPYNIAALVSYFIGTESCQGKAEVTGKRVNRGAGYGLEIPCTYIFAGRQKYVQKL